ncbi:PREDICTED: inactive disease resistance protein RPS4-like [Camelina sativa]|uniref:ADP-ribosyl cyclase/cyclic ADP-ribose hydrolase n=1 Tax=Camelina sativa TaxID=90675 RepID=A0ABM0U1C3_CAMSA|nr:PREDICTED: inactive disease resistance protein RPS4-like [Camelina sativa]XP_010434399.1 PREDICTED: inactive disease resistance protein RPS4-like [Camelina sativa]XP_010434400.1 PREDICTED: inactive disease resistance protein RPS4-like [Camelina sativa]
MAFLSSSSSFLDPSKRQFDVFVSFRGADTRNSFTSYLLQFLHRKGIDAFFDGKLRRGKDISVVFDRIEQSKMSIVIFSQNYANSTWCLEELWKIMQCREKFGHGVLPVFYKVRKSDVENQRGSFGAPFLSPKDSFKGDGHKIGAWKEALKIASNILGYVLPEERPESEFVEKVAKETFRMLNDLSPCEIIGFPGIESRSKELEELLMFDNTNCIRTVGVLGMTGIGKTTVTDSVYKRKYRQFDGYCFLEDIENESKRHGLHNLHQKLLCKLLDEENVDVRAHGRLKDFLRNKKLFIVLDNVTDVNQIEFLIGQQELYRKGSRIVITTRDKKLLQNNADATYIVPRLNDSEAMELFCLDAFSDSLYPTEEFLDLSNNFVYYAKGHPLALKLLGSGLRQKERTYWVEKWERLTVEPDKEIQKVLKLSYEALDDEQKSIFLDIACFFRSEKADLVSSILKSDHVMRELEDKCLVTISYNRLEMHDLMHAMGKKIGSESSIKRAGKRSRLWNHKDIRHVLEQRTGTECVRGIFLNMSNVEKIKLSPDVFMRMSNLKFLKFHKSHCSQWCDNDHKFLFSEGLDHFPDELVYLHWQGYPYEYLPSEFNPEELVDLSLRYSFIKQLWENEKVPCNTEKLRWVDLSQSKDLQSLSGLSMAKNLERLDLEGCTSLVLLGSSIKQMNKLIYLNLRDCTSLESLPKGINLKSLKTLILSGCSNLQEFQIISDNIGSLYLEGSAIEKVVEHIESLRNLILLNLKNCRRLKFLPKDLYKLKSLQELILSGCSALESLPPIKEEMECLEILLMDGTSIKQTPEKICLSNLKMFSFCGSIIEDSEALVLLPFSGSFCLSDLYLTNCNIYKFPDNFSSLYSLRCLCLSRNNIETLPESIKKLQCLWLLDLKHCCKLNSLPVLPSSLQYVDAHGCVSLEKVAKPVSLPLVTDRMHTTFLFTNCFKLNRSEQEAIVTQAKIKSQLLARTSLQHNHKGLVLEPLVAVCFPGNDIPSWFCYQRMGSSIETDLLPHWCNSKFIGASLSIVVSFKDNEGHHVNRLSVRCKCEFKNQNGQSISFSFCLGGWNESCGSSCHEPRKLRSDHVFISYNNCSVPILEWMETSNDGNRCHLTSASFEFYLTDETERKVECCKVIRCGMSLLYAPDENDRGFQGIRVTDTVERTSSEAVVTIRGQSHSRIEEKKNGKIRDEILDMSISSIIRGPGF